MFQCAGRECGDDVRRPWEPGLESLQKDFKHLSQKLEVVQEYANKLEKFNGVHDIKTKEIEAVQISQQRRVSELEAASAETARQLPLFATSAELAELNPAQMRVTRTSHTWNQVSTEEVRADMPEIYTERQEEIESRLSALEQQTPVGVGVGAEKIESRLNALEQRFSRFEQRLSNVEELAVQKPQLMPHSTQTDNLPAEMVNRQPSSDGFSDEPSINELQGREQERSEGHEKSARLSRLSSSSASAVAMRHMEYAWKPTIWDTAVFIFSEQMKFGESFVVFDCLVFTLVLLTAFGREVENLIGDKYARFDDVSQQDYYLWRTTVAHDIDFRNKFTDASLASTICNGKLYAAVSSLQLQTVRDLQDYLKEHAIIGIAVGQWLALLSVCVWFLVLVQEFRNIFDLMGASLRLKQGFQTTFLRNRDDDTLEILTVSFARRVFLGVILTLRFGIVCILAWEGTLFLLAEVDLENMILNSVALQMMLSFDDLLYHVVPPIPQEIIRRMQPLKIPSSKCPKWWHEFGFSIFLAGSISIALFVFHIVYNAPFLEDVKNSYDALCGGVDGSYDFVVAMDAIGMPWAAATTPISDNMQEMYVQRAIASTREFNFQGTSLRSSQRSNLGLFMQVASSWDLQHAVTTLPEFNDATEWSMINPAESADVVGWENELWEVLNERDFADAPDTVYNHYLQHLLKQTGDVSCAQVPASSCNKPGRKAEDVVMRKLCPTHCGCSSPTEGTVANTYGSSSRSNFTGCAAWNTRRKIFVDELQYLPCADTQSLNDFVSWSRGVGNAVSNSGGMLIAHLLSAFDSGKCPDVAKIDFNGLRICQETSLPSICPESCGCNTSQAWTSVHTSRFEYCPYSCKSLQPPCMTVPVTHTQDPGPRGPYAGFACIFPFKYQGVTYHSCTSRGWTGPWCAVTLVDGVSKLWGDCPSTSACVDRAA